MRSSMRSQSREADWSRYSISLLTAGEYQGYSRAHLQELIDYAQPIFLAGLPVIYDHEHLGQLVGYDPSYLLAASNGQLKFYRVFMVAKRGPAGGFRVIAEPLPSLKEIQRWILHEILDRVSLSVFAKAYVPGRSVLDNAKFHRRQPVVVRFDLTNFFGSVSERSVFGVFSRLGYHAGVARLLTRLCTLTGSLPQGAPTSGALANLACRRLDARLGGWARRASLRYSRYADDMTFSGPDLNVANLSAVVRKIVDECGYSINDAKTHVSRAGQRQLVTGVVVNWASNPPREVRRRFRQQVYYIRRYGLDGHIRRIGERRRNFLLHLIGTGAYLLQLRPKDRSLREDVGFLRRLSKEYAGESASDEP